MARETGLTKREQQTARRKLLALGVIQIERRGFKFTYHFRIVWERLYQVIEQSLREQNVPTEPIEPIEPLQTVSTEPIQNVPTQPPEPLQNVPTERQQNLATANGHRDYTREEKVPERTDRVSPENHTTWNKIIEQVRIGLSPEEAERRLAGTTLLELSDTAARIGVANPFLISWLERRLYSQIAQAIKGILGKDVDLQFIPAT